MSKRWLQEHHSDQFVKRSKVDGYASRAAYKLLEVQKKDRLIRPGMTVVDLGAAPGGWSQVAAKLVGVRGKVIALDILEMDPIPNVTIIKGDFTEDAALDELLAVVGDDGIDVVISDMAPNFTGHKSVDQPRSMALTELAFDCAMRVLKPKGSFLVKVFQGEGVDNLLRDMRKNFRFVKSRKPLASRSRSSEIYILGSDFLGYNGH